MWSLIDTTWFTMWKCFNFCAIGHIGLLIVITNLCWFVCYRMPLRMTLGKRKSLLWRVIQLCITILPLGNLPFTRVIEARRTLLPLYMFIETHQWRIVVVIWSIWISKMNYNQNLKIDKKQKESIFLNYFGRVNIFLHSSLTKWMNSDMKIQQNWFFIFCYGMENWKNDWGK